MLNGIKSHGKSLNDVKMLIADLIGQIIMPLNAGYCQIFGNIKVGLNLQILMVDLSDILGIG